MRGFRFVVIVQAALLLGATLFAAPGGDGSTIRIWFSHIEPENLAMVAIAEEFTKAYLRWSDSKSGTRGYRTWLAQGLK
ncbi:MAG TPA: hypothetical protein PKG97_03100 [Mesotoga infera]|nr:hypothetical protein [Mesotoga infera]